MSSSILRVTDISKSFAERTVFTGVSIEVVRGECAALVGPNGVGKTTVLRIICGDESPDSGSVWISEGVSIGYVPQNPTFTEGATLRTELDRLPNEYPVLAGMKRFGFSKSELCQAVETMSGGQKTRLALLKVWAAGPSLLLLDEPTNHLDMAGHDWLESFVKSSGITVLVVSHDRYFLDRVATRIIQLSSCGTESYIGNYTAYRLRKAEERRIQEAQWEANQRETQRLERAIEQQLKWFHVSHRDAGKTSELRKGVKEYERARAARIAVRAKCTIRRLERMIDRGVDKPQDDPTVDLGLVDAEKTGRRVIVAEEVGMEYGRTVFDKANFHVMRGDRVGLVGPNAAGKTTLLRIIMGLEVPSRGNIWVSESAKIGYMDQEFKDLPIDMTAFQSVLDVTGRTDAAAQLRVRSLLGSLLMRGEDVNKPVRVLSYGERMRLVIARLLLSKYEVLVLDEPTNHLDLPTRERLEEALEGWVGTLLLVSHDRYLVDRLCNKILSIENAEVRLFPGSYSEFTKDRAARMANTSREKNSNNAGEHDDKKARKDHLLVMMNRLAVLSSELYSMSKNHPDYPARESEFLEVGRAVHAARSQLGYRPH